MPLDVNFNLAANSTLIALNNDQLSYSTEVKRLSSGLRINSAADDPAGLVISQKFELQVAGLNQAIANANDGIQLTQTADGALGEVSNLLESMRNLAENAANVGANDSAAIQADQSQISAAIQTINRIASTTQFGERQLLNGSSGVTASSSSPDVSFVSGSTATTSGTYSLQVTTAAAQGQVASAAPLTVASVTGGATAGGATTAASVLTLSGNLVNGGVAYKLSIPAGSTLADVANDINTDATLASNGIDAKVTGTQLVLTSTHLSGAGAAELSVQASTGDLHTASGIDNTVADASTAVNATADAEIRNAETLTFGGGGNQINVTLASGESINEAVGVINTALKTAAIGVTAAWDATTSKFTFTNNAYGSSNTVQNTILSNLAGSVAGGAINLDLTSTANAQENIASYGGADVAGTFTDQTGTTYTVQGSGQTLTGSNGTPLAGLELNVAGGFAGKAAIDVTNASMTFQIGAFANQTVQLAIPSISAQNLGTSATGLSAYTPTVNLASIDVTRGNGAGAQDALQVIDAASAQISQLRATLGAFQTDTIESSIQDMTVASQNMNSAEAQIRDANMAQETLAYSRAQVLQQTGMAMLTQANQAPQQVLKLFQ